MELWKKDFLNWLKEICPKGDIIKYCYFYKLGTSLYIHAQFYTAKYEYHIIVTDTFEGGPHIKCCHTKIRKPAAGFKVNNCITGLIKDNSQMSKKNLELLKNKIIQNELEEIHKVQRLGYKGLEELEKKEAEEIERFKTDVWVISTHEQ